MDSRTIVAPMTPAGVSAVAAIRVSGPQVRDVVLALFGERAVARLESHKARLGTARDPKTGETVDSLLYLFFEGPNSYTGEDTLELYPHGNPLIVRELIQAIRKVQGVRLAEPGEFTRRAFLNGKMDLVQAESVADVIHSANRAELKNAHRLLSGTLSKKIQELNEQVKDMSARLELDVDFAEEEADPDYDSWRKRIVAIGEKISEILQSFRGKENLSRLPLVVLYGAPNAGKSSLVNALLGEDRILVSSVPGTTRDFVEVRLFLPGGEIRLVDTAGIADRATDELDALSMEKSREILKEADLKIHVVDGCLDERTGCALQTKDESVRPDMTVITKKDLLDSAGASRDQNSTPYNLLVSSKTGEGLAGLRQKMDAALFTEGRSPEDIWITSERERACLAEAFDGVKRALDLLQKQPAVELLAFEMQLVRRSLQSVVGEISSEDILQSIFAGFCIGK
ncbi:tRNA uridine-5-carboxymethylaminomethyl(34) synthesis GTPase MnmE [Fibrobacter sp.]|uniref:tRNA uridine-5-carboxymethylaminomethyl(34) synthesis GTPase MnmE n=1 Tax=Fibrobacter sp. TaxID=35828 RepID=UPI00388EB764